MQNLYRDFAGKHALPLHLQPQWLDAVCGDVGWGACVVTGKNGSVQSVMPYYLKKKLGMDWITLPPYTQYGGPFFQYPETHGMKNSSLLGFEMEMIGQLQKQLPDSRFFKISMRPNQKYHLPWQWLGYTESVQYTYLFPSDMCMHDVRMSYKNKLRVNLAKAKESVEVRVINDAELLYDLMGYVFKKRNKKNPYPKQQLQNLYANLAPLGQAQILAAFELKTNQPVAATLIAQDQNQMHCIISGQNNQYKDARAMNLLFDTMIEQALNQGKTLDLEGSMIPNIEHFFRSLGGVLTPYSVISKASPLLRIGASILGR